MNKTVLFFLIVSSLSLFSIDTSTWKYDHRCEKGKLAIESIIAFGVNRITRIRTDIKEKLEFAQDLNFSCPLVWTEDISMLAYFDNEDQKHEIVLNNNILRDLKIISEISTEDNNIYLSIFNNFTWSFSGQNPFNILFHEFLHSIRVDNYPTEKHNEMYALSDEVKFTDHILACSEVVYPAEEVSLFHLTKSDTPSSIMLMKNLKENVE